MDFVAKPIELGDVEILDVEEPAQLLPDFLGEVFLVQRGTERSADFIQHMKFFGAARGLLNQVAVLHRHADLVAEGEKQAQLGGSKAAVVWCAEQQHAKSLFFGLEADGHDAAQSLCQCQFTETADGFLFFQSRKRVVAKIAESQQSSETRHEVDEIIVQAFVLCGAAKFIAQSHGHDGGRPLRVPMMQEESSSWKAHHAEDAVQGLREHALNFAADETGSCEVKIRKRQHVALDAALFFFV